MDFFELVKTGTLQDIKAAIGKGVDINAWDKDGRTPLMEAVWHNQNPEVVTTLLRAGAKIEAQSKSGATALLYAAEYNQNPEVITTLLKAGADIKANKDGFTTLMGAVDYNLNPEVITALLEAGADVNAQDKDGFTALMYAAMHTPYPEVITALLAAGADAKAKNSAGMTALYYAQGNKHLGDTDAYWQLQEAQQNEQTKAQVQTQDENVVPPFSIDVNKSANIPSLKAKITFVSATQSDLMMGEAGKGDKAINIMIAIDNTNGAKDLRVCESIFSWFIEISTKSGLQLILTVASAETKKPYIPWDDKFRLDAGDVLSGYMNVEGPADLQLTDLRIRWNDGVNKSAWITAQ